ncbi:hypothetical protein BGY98DRAFT_935373 [Russula aff. rugulosa BPL654]|nr:hypothetical protein BGY98DRAFT_935373 [Russula aff. rugulosa BPL654]
MQYVALDDAYICCAIGVPLGPSSEATPSRIELNEISLRGSVTRVHGCLDGDRRLLTATPLPRTCFSLLSKDDSGYRNDNISKYKYGIFPTEANEVSFSPMKKNDEQRCRRQGTETLAADEEHEALVEREWPLSNDAAAAVISCGCIAAGIRIDRDRHRHRHRLGLGEDSGEEGE